ncbi:uncharacterized protein LOC144650377 [Oculina patagonica]
MTWVEDIDSMFPWATSNLRAMYERVVSLKDCQVMRALRQTKQFIENHPLISLFLAILVIIGFLPFFVFLAFVSSSFVVVSMSALALLGGSFVVAFFSFLVVLSPLLVFGGILAVFVYLTFRFAMRILQVFKQLKYKLYVSRHSRRHPRCKESIQFVDCQVEPASFPVEYEHSFITATNEELSREEESLNSHSSYLSY